MRTIAAFATVLFACGAPPLPPPPPAPPLAPIASASAAPPVADAGLAIDAAPPARALHFTQRPFALPGATGTVSLDYLAYERAAGRVWIPAGNTGSVDVLDVAKGAVVRIEGFKTSERDVRGQKRVMGPSAAAIGDGVVYVGNRGTSEICTIDAAKLTRGACLTLPTSPDGLLYVAATKELWVTTPRDKSVTVLDASKPAKLAPKATIALDGASEGYAVDETRGLFFTNLEDRDKTVSIDTKTHKVTATWDPKCGSEGPRGLAVDTTRGFLFVACTTGVVVLDVAHGGAQLAKLDTGGGVDNIDYLPEAKQLYAAAGKAAVLVVASVDDKGALSVLGTAPTAQGARVVIADRDGVAYVADPAGGRVLAFVPGP